MEIPLWRRQFPLEYDAPSDELVARGFEDQSWGNDICPHFVRGKLEVWSDHPDQKTRELSTTKRFTLIRVDSDDREDFETIFETDQLSELLGKIDELDDWNGSNVKERLENAISYLNDQCGEAEMFSATWETLGDAMNILIDAVDSLKG
jgi:hypothetical protein